MRYAAAAEAHRASPVRLESPRQLRAWSERCRAAGLLVGLVPTMGALHGGHRSLIRRAIAGCDRVVVSMFVNPTQFGAKEDLDRYPRALTADLELLEEEEVHAAFIPTVEEMYPPGSSTRVTVGSPLATTLEGASRPGHLDGVALIVAKLLVAARPDRAYFGRKDAQQCAVVRRLATDLDSGVEIVSCPTVRDPDGLAVSSRNAYLAAEERRRALAVPAALAAAASLFQRGEREVLALRRAALQVLGDSVLDVDYVAVVDGDDFTELREAAEGSHIVLAARIGSTRLIDALSLGIDRPPPVTGRLGLDAGEMSAIPVHAGGQPPQTPRIDRR